MKWETKLAIRQMEKSRRERTIEIDSQTKK